MSNVNGQAVAQAKLEALIAVTQRWIAYMEVPQRREAWGPLVEDAKAAIAEARKSAALSAPAPEGDVVARAAEVIQPILDRWTCGAATDTVVDRLHAAGLLAGPMDRERLARALHASFGGSSTEWERGLNEKHRDSWRHTADAILREWGGR